LDSLAHVWLNGQDLGQKRIGNFGSLEVDLSAALKRDTNNILLIAVDNTFPNEIGVGGILRPALIYIPKS
jgi:hypothetical protein